jgi:hypothetical protein
VSFVVVGGLVVLLWFAADGLGLRYFVGVLHPCWTLVLNNESTGAFYGSYELHVRPLGSS